MASSSARWSTSLARPNCSATGMNSRGRGDRAVEPLHAQQAFVQLGLVAPRGHDRLQREDHAAVVERADDLVGDGHGAAALRVPALARLIEVEAVAAAAARDVERLKGPADCRLRAPGMLGKEHRADRDGRRHRAHAGIDDAVADRRHEAAGDGLDPLPAAVLQHNAELVRREAADAVLAAQGAADAAPDDGDHLVADVVAIGLVDESEIVDAGEQERALGGVPAGAAEKAGEFFGQPASG